MTAVDCEHMEHLVGNAEGVKRGGDCDPRQYHTISILFAL